MRKLEMKRIPVILLRAISKFFALFPLKFHYFWADFIAWILRDVVHYRRNVVTVNIARSFPRLRYREVEQLVDQFYTHLAEVVVETIWFSGATHAKLQKCDIVRVTNPEVLKEYFDNSPSVMILYSHCGNWELLGGILSYDHGSEVRMPVTEQNLKIVYKKLNSPMWDEFMKGNRTTPTSDYHGLVETGQLMRYIVGHRREKCIYLLNIDQSPYRGAGAHDIGAFLNQPTQASLGPAGLASRLGMSVLFMSFDRVARGRYEMTFTPICPDASRMKPAYILREYYDLLEKEIQANPVNWLWSHRRWKQRTDVMEVDLDTVK